MTGRQRGDGLVDHVGLVGLQVIHPALPDQLDHPARVEIDAEADAAAMLREVLHREAQAARTARPEHQPVGPLREALVGQRVGEQLVVGPEVVDGDAALRYAGRPARLRTRRSACPRRPRGTQRRTGPPRSHSSSKWPNFRRSSKPSTSRRGSQPAFSAHSSQNGEPVAGSKCHATTSRTRASSDARDASALPCRSVVSVLINQ